MAYDGSIDLISGIRAKNNQTFPLVNAPDVRIDDSTRLSDFVQSINNKEGSANGFATLDQNGKVPSSQLPSYVDDVLEYTNQSSFPSTGETGKIYVAKDTNKTYRWSGSGYVVISETLALGETSSTAYRGDRGKTAYDHASAKGSAFSSGLYKITTNAQGHVTAAVSPENADIYPLVIDDNATGIPATTKTWSAQKSIDELAKKVNDADLFAGIDIYDPNSASQGQFTFNADAYAHQAGTNYIVHNTDEGVYVIPPASLESACLSYETLMFTEYVQRIADNTIDDTAGNGVTDKTWSADKIYDELATKVVKTRTVNGHALSSNVTVTKSDVGLGNCDNTSDADKPVSTAQQTALDNKASKSYPKFFGTVEVDNNELIELAPVWDSSVSYVVGDIIYDSYTYNPGGGNVTYKGWYYCKQDNTNKRPYNNSTYWKILGSTKYIEVIGNGSDSSNKSNARMLDWAGNEYLNGDLYIGCNADSTGGNKVISDLDIMAIYTGVSEYTPVANVSFAPGIFYRQIGANYIGMLKGDSSLEIFLNSGTYQIPSESDNNWDIMYFGDPRLKEAMIFPLEGITEYTPVNDAHFGTSSAYHEVGSKYICVTKDNTLLRFSEGGYPGAGGGFGAGVTNGVYHLPRSSDSNVDVYTIGQFLHAWRTKRVSTSSPVLSDDLSIVGAKLSRAQLLTLLGLTNDSNAYATPPTTIKLGSTTLTETQLQELLSLVSATGVGF